MRVIALKTLKVFWEAPNRRDAEQPLKAWYAEVKEARWTGPADVKKQYRSASFLKDNRIVFNIAGNKYRLIVKVSLDYTVCLIRFIGTHKEYDKIDAGIV